MRHDAQTNRWLKTQSQQPQASDGTRGSRMTHTAHATNSNTHRPRTREPQAKRKGVQQAKHQQAKVPRGQRPPPVSPPHARARHLPGNDDGLHGHPPSDASPPGGGSRDVGVTSEDSPPAPPPPSTPHPDSYDGDAYMGDGKAYAGDAVANMPAPP